MIDWKLKDFTEEERREKHEETYVHAPVSNSFLSIRNETPQDISGIIDIVNRANVVQPNTKLRNSARRKPEEIILERSFDIQQIVKADKDKSVSELRFFKPNTKNTRGKKPNK